MSDMPQTQVTPYIGLIPYAEQDAPFFFGRERERAIITANLMASRLTVLYGPSGAGKSSLLRAGVEHTLREQTRRNIEELGRPEMVVVVFNNWRDNPVVSLSQTVQAVVKQTLAALNQVDDPSPDPRALVENLEAWTKDIDSELLIILDQFEEYFLYHAQEDGEGTFAVEFPCAVNAPGLRVNFLVSLREDALSKLDRFKGRIPRLFENYLRIGHLTRDAGRDAIEKPLAEYNRRQTNESERIAIEPALVDAVLSQVQTGRVTLAGAGSGGVEDGAGDDVEGGVQRTAATIETSYLQLVMTRLWNEERQAASHTLQRATLDRLGSAENIVRTHLDSVMAGLSLAERDIAAEVFRYLVTPSGTKIAYTAKDLVAYTSTSSAKLTAVLEKLSGSGLRVLRTVDPPPDQPRETRYEIFHDVLASAILDWRGRYVHEKEKRDIEENLVRAAEAERRRAEEQAEAAARLRRQRMYLVGMLIALLFGIGAVIFSFRLSQAAAEARAARDHAEEQRQVADEKSQEAQRQTRIAEEQSKVSLYRQLAAQTSNLLPDHFDLALLLSVETARMGDTISHSYESRDSLLKTLETNPKLAGFLFGYSNGVRSAAFSPVGKILASGDDNGSIILWDVEKRQSLGTLTGHSYPVWSVAFSPDGKTLASGSCSKSVDKHCTESEIMFWDVATRQRSGVPLKAHSSAVFSVAFSRDGKTLASGGCAKFTDNKCTKGEIILWDVAKRQPLSMLTGHSDWVYSVVFSPDGKTLASGGLDHDIILWDVAKHKPLGEPLNGHSDAVNTVAFSPDGKILASGSCGKTADNNPCEGEIMFWDMATHKPLGEPLVGHSGGVVSVAFSPDGQTLASGGQDSSIILWDVATRQPLADPLKGHSGAVNTVAFSPDGMLASGSVDRSIILWEVAKRQRLGEPLIGHSGKVWSVAFSPDSKFLASGGGEDSRIVLWDVAKRKRLATLAGQSSQVVSVAFSRDGKTLASGGCAKFTDNKCTKGEIILWDVAKRQPLSMLTGHSDWVYSVVFSPDGKTLASGGLDHDIILWDVAKHKPLGEPLNGHSGVVWSVAFSPDGKILASGSCGKTAERNRCDGEIMFWDMATHKPLGEPLVGHSGGVVSVAFSPDGQTLASGGQDSSIILWDVATRQPLADPLKGHSSVVMSVAFSPDGQMLASGGVDHDTILWDVATRQRLGEPLTSYSDTVWSVAFSPDGKFLASGGCGKLVGGNCTVGEVTLWDVDPINWRARICQMAGHNLTKAEWKQYFGGQPYRKTCDLWPDGQ